MSRVRPKDVQHAVGPKALRHGSQRYTCQRLASTRAAGKAWEEAPHQAAAETGARGCRPVVGAQRGDVPTAQEEGPEQGGMDEHLGGSGWHQAETGRLHDTSMGSRAGAHMPEVGCRGFLMWLCNGLSWLPENRMLLHSMSERPVQMGTLPAHL